LIAGAYRLSLRVWLQDLERVSPAKPARATIAGEALTVSGLSVEACGPATSISDGGKDATHPLLRQKHSFPVRWPLTPDTVVRRSITEDASSRLVSYRRKGCAIVVPQPFLVRLRAEMGLTPSGRRQAEQTAQTSSLRPNPMLYALNPCQAWYKSGRH
jgi:hypothetical protein